MILAEDPRGPSTSSSSSFRSRSHKLRAIGALQSDPSGFFTVVQETVAVISISLSSRDLPRNPSTRISPPLSLFHGNTSQPPCLSDLSISSSPRDGRGDRENRDEQGGWDVRVDRGEDGEVESDYGDGERRRMILVEDRIGSWLVGSSREVEGGGGLGARWREGIRSTVPSR